MMGGGDEVGLDEGGWCESLCSNSIEERRVSSEYLVMREYLAIFQHKIILNDLTSFLNR